MPNTPTETLPVPHTLPGIFDPETGLEYQELSDPTRGSVNACIGASSVLDQTAWVTPKELSSLKKTMEDSRAWQTNPTDKYGAAHIFSKTTGGKKRTVTFVAEDDPKVSPQITIEESKIKESIGGGAQNGMMDAAVIKKALKALFGLTNIPRDTLTFSAPIKIREEVIKRVTNVGLPELTVNAQDGTIRETYALNDGTDKITISTQSGNLAEGEDLPPIDPKTGYILFNNEVSPRVFQDMIKHARQNPATPQNFIWAVGSNQLNQDPNNFDVFLQKCNTVILNLDEAVKWILNHSDPAFSQDKALLDLLEDIPEGDSKKAAKLYDKANKALEVLAQGLTRIGLNTPQKKTLPINKKRIPSPPKEPKSGKPRSEQITKAWSDYKVELDEYKKRRTTIAQRIADIIHSMGLELGTVYITDGGNPTISSRRYNSKKRKEPRKKQLYIPPLSDNETEKIKNIIRQFTESEPAEYTIGCGDSVAGTILALKQMTGDQALPSTINIVANYISCLIRWMPYPNLLEIEAVYPGMTQEVIKIALQDLDKNDKNTFEQRKLEPIPPEAKGRKISPFMRMIQAHKSPS